jgi:D-alanyl-D-alanine carboxypeptidase
MERYMVTLKNKLIVLALIAGFGCADYTQELNITPCDDDVVVSNPDFPKASKVDEILNKLAGQGVPGAAIAIYSQDGWFTSSAGVASIEKNTPMQDCYLQYLQSISKTYMAVVILKLYEEGRIGLDAPITKYLPEDIAKKIPDAEKVSVRMLLNHTSGIPEYNSAPAYVSYLLQHPHHVFKPVEYLKYVEGKPLTFTPGSRYSYRNTNYLLLALIADVITGDHARYMEEVIFKPMNLTRTFYRSSAGYLNYSEMVNSYWDRYSNGILENVSELQRTNVRSLIGDDGIVATPVDAVKFLIALNEGHLLSDTTFNLMKTWVNDTHGKPTYGLGLDHATFEGEVAYGHSGGGLGAGSQLYYFPSKKIYVFIGINLGTVTDSPIHRNAEHILEEFYRTILE